jgi:hypothetical protein
LRRRIKHFAAQGREGVVLRERARVKPVLFQIKPTLFFAAALGVAVFCSHAAPRTAGAYDGLVSGSSGGDGYDGLLAPSQPSNSGNNRGTQEPPGYEGLIRGAVPQRPVEAPDADNPVSPSRPSTAATPPSATTPGTRAPRPAQTARQQLPMTPQPGRVRPGRVSSAEQLMTLARLNGVQLDFNKILNEKTKASPALLGLPDPKQPRINGMLPMELMAKTQIDKIMAGLSHPSLTPEQRQEIARNGYSQLLGYVDGIMTRRMVPDKLYKNAGMSDAFLAEEHEANERAMARFEEAFKILRPLQ